MPKSRKRNHRAVRTVNPTVRQRGDNTLAFKQGDALGSVNLLGGRASRENRKQHRNSPDCNPAKRQHRVGENPARTLTLKTKEEDIVRKKPCCILSDEAWEKFDAIAERDGLGDHEEDWMPWFDLFVSGYAAALEED